VATSSELHFAAAQLALRIASAADLKAAASSAADAGTVTPNIAALITLGDDTLAEAEPIFRKALEEVGVATPTLDEAVWLLLRKPISAIAEGSRDAEQGLKEIMTVYSAANLHGRSTQYVGDSHGIQYLVGTYWEIHDVQAHSTEVDFQRRYGDALQKLRDVAVEHARAWLAAHAA